MVSSKILRGMLDDAWDSTPEDGRLRETLRANESNVLLLIKGGSIQSTGANGRSLSLSPSAVGAVTQVEIAEAWRRLIDVFDTSASEIGAVADGSQDDVIYTQMMGNLREVINYTNNFMYLSK